MQSQHFTDSNEYCNVRAGSLTRRNAIATPLFLSLISLVSEPQCSIFYCQPPVLYERVVLQRFIFNARAAAKQYAHQNKVSYYRSASTPPSVQTNRQQTIAQSLTDRQIRRSLKINKQTIIIQNYVSHDTFLIAIVSSRGYFESYFESKARINTSFTHVGRVSPGAHLQNFNNNLRFSSYFDLFSVDNGKENKANRCLSLPIAKQLNYSLWLNVNTYGPLKGVDSSTSQLLLSLRHCLAGRYVKRPDNAHLKFHFFPLASARNLFFCALFFASIKYHHEK